MKYLSHYMEEQQTKVFNDTGSFFAFSPAQFEKQKQEGVVYVSVGSGLICPQEHAFNVVERLDSIYTNAIAEDLAENGKDGVIERELANHEAYYTGNIEDTVYALKDYGITNAEILAVYKRIAPTYNN
jgi:hypothetical protein